MADWNTGLYLKFKAERTQPAMDLANRLRGYHPSRIADLGCGPGNSTAVVKAVFPEAEVTGLDNSESMIRKAREEHPGLQFRLCGVTELEGEFDLLFSNACLQWLPDHGALLPRLMEHLTPGGVLAVQIPMNQDEPLFRIIRQVASQPKWGFRNIHFDVNETLEPAEYYDILSGCSSAFQIWETIYCHALPSHEALLDWVRGTRLRPYLEALDDAGAAAFEQELLLQAREAYPVQKDGNVLLRFRRFFFTAERSS